MPAIDFRSPRLFVEPPLEPGAEIPVERSQANYLCNVLRLKAGDSVLVFNGRDGEWHASLKTAGRKAFVLVCEVQTRPQRAAQELYHHDLHYLFAPLKHARLDYVVQKATEMGASWLQPVLTAFTQASRVSAERMRANAIEAAEQCGILTVPEIAPAIAFERMIAARDPARLLVFCDEAAAVADPISALAAAAAKGAPRPPLALLIGPEGGFSEAERTALLRLPNVVRLALGPRILRADTAAVAALALVQSVLGDWREG